LQKKRVVSLDVHCGAYAEFVAEVIRLAKAQESSYMCLANVHMCGEAWKDKEFGDIVSNADIVAPDGKPLAIALKLLYGVNQPRVAGMDLLTGLLSEAEQKGIGIYFYGSTKDVLSRVCTSIKREYPDLNISGYHSPPFRSLTDEEKRQDIDRINKSGAKMVLVALGCPLQERWMAANKGEVRAVMVGLGWAFSVYAGLQKRAPVWMQQWALEWLYRLSQEPRRLFMRYLVTNSLFVFLFVRQYVRVHLLATQDTDL